MCRLQSVKPGKNLPRTPWQAVGRVYHPIEATMDWQGNPIEPGLRNIDAVSAEVAVAFRAGDAVALQTRAEWNDEALMVAISARDQTAFVAMYDRYSALVYSTSLRILTDSQLAEDVTQDVFVRLWNRPETFVAERGRFLSWLMSVSRNRAVDQLRARGRRRRREVESLIPTEEYTAIVGDEEDPAHTAQIHEEQWQVRRALVCLPVDQRRALELAYFGGLTQQEIAAALHEPLGTIKTRIRLGMMKLRRALESER